MKNSPAEAMSKLKKLLLEAANWQNPRTYVDVLDEYGYYYRGKKTGVDDSSTLPRIELRLYMAKDHLIDLEPKFLNIVRMTDGLIEKMRFEFYDGPDTPPTYKSPDMNRSALAEALDKKLKELNPHLNLNPHQEPTV